MNILFFYQKKPYPPQCGGSNRVWNLAKTLVVLGNEVTIIFPGQKYRLEETIDGVRLISVPLSKRPLFKDYFYNP